MHVALMRHAIADHFGDGEHLEVVFLAERDEIRDPRHGSVVVHDLADDACRNHPCQTSEIDRGLGLSRAHQNSAFAGAKRKDVSWACQVGRCRGGVDGYLDRASPIIGGYSCGDADTRVDRFAERGSILRGVLRSHGPDAQVIETLLSHGEADQPAAKLGHEVDRFRSHLLRREGKVALVLAVFIVDHHDHAAGADLLDGGGDVDKGLVAHNEAIVSEHFIVS